VTGGVVRGWLVDLRDPALNRAGVVRPDDLGAADLDRAAGKRPDTRAGFLLSRWVVRVLLGQALGEPPGRLRVAHRDGGGPWLPAHPDTHVSWSRSDGCLLLALSADGPLGVDVEALRPVREPARVLEAVYPMAIALGTLDDPAHFFGAWTLLEAAVKATGRGLAAGARDVDLVRPAANGPCVLRGVRNSGQLPWTGEVLRLARPTGGEVVAGFVHTGRPAPVDLVAWPQVSEQDSSDRFDLLGTR